jgi:hypothetical protein
MVVEVIAYLLEDSEAGPASVPPGGHAKGTAGRADRAKGARSARQRRTASAVDESGKRAADPATASGVGDMV